MQSGRTSTGVFHQTVSYAFPIKPQILRDLKESFTLSICCVPVCAGAGEAVGRGLDRPPRPLPAGAGRAHAVQHVGQLARGGRRRRRLAVLAPRGLPARLGAPRALCRLSTAPPTPMRLEHRRPFAFAMSRGHLSYVKWP